MEKPQNETVQKRLHLLVLTLLSLLASSAACSSTASEAAGRNTKSQSSASLPTLSPTPQPPLPKPIQAQRIEQIWSSRYAFTSQSITESHEGIRGYELAVEIPTIKHSATPATRRFNRWIKKKILGYVAQFKQLEHAAEISEKRKKIPPLQITESLELGYQVYYSNQRLISLRLTHSVMAIGQMHPIAYYETINYDLKKGRLLRTADIFKPGYLKLLSEYCRLELSDKYDLGQGNLNWVNTGTFPKRDNFANWNIVPDGILLSFADYQVGPHSFGQPEMIVPFSALGKPLVKRNFSREFFPPGGQPN